MTDIMQEVAWHDPRDAVTSLLHNAPDSAVCLLFSGLHTSYSGRYSFLAWEMEEHVSADSLAEITSITTHTTPLPHWFGWIAYEAGNALHDVPRPHATPLPTSLLDFVRYRHVIRYDHELRECHYHGTDVRATEQLLTPHPLPEHATFPAAESLIPHIPRAQYLEKIKDTIAQIHAGNFYQANLTCKYSGSFATPLTAIGAWAGFLQLHQLSPAPYSAFISRADRYILSSSPELFLHVADHRLTSRPIKGTVSIQHHASVLEESLKNKAENLMIVDLMRNDFAACALKGSVQVPHLWEIDSFRTLHHLSSTITATLPANYHLADILRATFPAGSMTGAPKRAAMHWIARTEGIERGIYSGALGWINGHDAELSVVIRTLIASRHNYEFQVGGGIVADSLPHEEYEEILTKALALLTLLQQSLPAS